MWTEDRHKITVTAYDRGLRNIPQHLNSLLTSEVGHSYPSTALPKHQGHTHLASEDDRLTASSVLVGQSPPVPDKPGRQIKTE